MIYIPTESNEEPLKSTVGVKFSNDIFISPSVLKKWNISYQENELEVTDLGKFARIIRE